MDDRRRCLAAPKTGRPAGRGVTILLALSLMLATGSPRLSRASADGPLALIGQVGGETYAIHVVGSIAYVGLGPRLVVLDVSNPAQPAQLGQTEVLPGVVHDVEVVGNIAYVADGSGGLRVFSVGDRANPLQIGALESSGYSYHLQVVGQYAYLADGWGGLRIISVTDPAHPSQIGSYATAQSARDVQVVGDIAYVPTYGQGLQIISASDKSHPTLLGTTTATYAVAVHADSHYAYVAVDTDPWGQIPQGLYIYDISGLPNTISTVGMFPTLKPRDVQVTGDTAYLTDHYDGLRTVSLADRAHPSVLHVTQTPGRGQDVFVTGQLAYVADGWGGLRIISVAGGVPGEIGAYDKSFSPLAVQAVGDTAYVAAGDEGLLVISASERTHPNHVGSVHMECTALDVQVVGDYAYVVAGGWHDRACGLHIISIVDQAHPSQVGFHEQRDVLPAQHSPQGVHVVGDYAYVADGWGGVRIISVVDKAHPTEAGFYDPAPGYHVEAVRAAGNYAYAAASMSKGLRVISIADKAHPTEVGFWEGLSLYSLETSGDYVFSGAGTSGLRVFSVADIVHPTWVAGYDTPGQPEGMDLDGDLIYVADRYADLLVLSVADKAHPGRVTTFDTAGSPRDVDASDGTVYVADESGGLVILSVLPHGLYLPMITCASASI